MEKTKIVMDYEKKDFRKLYEDLVKSDWFKKAYHDKSLGDCPFDISELAESEDERIRAVILKLVLGMRKEIFTAADELVTKPKVLAWLEKQKEPEYVSATTMIPSCWAEEPSLQKEQKEIPLMNGDADMYFDEWNQQNQNPTKRQCFEEGIRYAQKLQKEQKHPNGCFTCDEYKKGYEEGRRNGFTAGYNKAMKEVEQKEQKPWKVGANAYFTPEQKPVEWSEEDEKMRNLIVAIFEVNHPDDFFKANELGTTDMRGVHTEEIISWLKSLRPSWKPSEEQMKALKEVAYSIVGTGTQTDVYLVQLYEQLKKLM